MTLSLEDRVAMRRARTAAVGDNAYADALHNLGIEPVPARSGPANYQDLIIWTGALVPRGTAIFLSLEMGDAQGLDEALTYKWHWPFEGDDTELLQRTLDELHEPEDDAHSD